MFANSRVNFTDYYQISLGFGLMIKWCEYVALDFWDIVSFQTFYKLHDRSVNQKFEV